MLDPKEYIIQAFDECETVRTEKAQLYGHSWRLADYFTILNIIYSKLNAVTRSSEDWYESTTETLIATYNYAIFGHLQSEFELCTLYELSEEHNRVTEEVEKMDEEIKDTLTKKNQEYSNAWINCDFDYLFELILIKIARIQHLRETIQGSDDISREEAALKDAFVDIAGYAILCLARIFRETATDGE